IVGIATIVALFLVVTGVIVWWREKLWRVQWSASWKRILFDLHHSLGVFAAVVITIITASGLVIHYNSLSRWIYSLDQTPAQKTPPQSAAPEGARPITADSLYHIAQATLP